MMKVPAANRKMLSARSASFSLAASSAVLTLFALGCAQNESSVVPVDDSGVPDAGSAEGGGRTDDGGMPDARAPGSLDSTFGDGGIVIGPPSAEGHAVMLQPDGKIIVAGHTARPDAG